MIIQGKYNKAEIFTDAIDEEALKQLYNLLNNPAIADSKIAIMPDVHMGKGSVVGFTMTFNRFIIPSVIGVDIGCGIAAYKIGQLNVDFEDFDMFVKDNIPAGRQIHNKAAERFFSVPDRLEKLIVKVALQEYQRILCSIGSLGGGNHFIELDIDNDQNIWLVIHSGSRNLGLNVFQYHQIQAKKYIKKEYKGAGAYHGMEYMSLDGGGDEYLNDMQITQEYAMQNRIVMARIIIEEYFGKKISECESVSSIHNYMNFSDKIIRKGAIAAHDKMKLIIPLNMRDGSIIASGKGNPQWNYSAPHGAGRLLSRSQSKELITLDEFHMSMKGIYSSSINYSTIDESPMVYKSSDDITRLIQDTVDICFVMKPIYNFKGGKE